MQTDPGLTVVRELFRELMIDEEWSEWGDRSFTWWPHRTAQRISAAPAVERNGDLLSWVSVETDLFQVSAEEWPQAQQRFEDEALMASMSCLVWRDGFLRLRSATPVHEEMVGLTTLLLKIAAVEQAGQAEAWLAAIPDMVPAVSGSRPVPDELVQAAWQLPHRDDASRWAQADLEGLGERVWDVSDGAVYGSGAASGCTFEVPVGPEGGPALFRGISDLIEGFTESRHPVLGSGLALRLKLRFDPQEGGRNLRPLELNAIEARAPEEGGSYYTYQIGSWCIEPSRGLMTYTSFYPATVADSGLIQTLVMGQVNRSLWVGERFMGIDPDVSLNSSRERSARLIRRKERDEAIDDLLAPVTESIADTIRHEQAHPWPY